MTIDDLEKAGIANNGQIEARDFGNLILKYNKIYDQENGKFDELMKKVLSKFDVKNLDEKSEKEFVAYCLAISNNDIKNAYLSEKDDLKRLIEMHKLVSKKRGSTVKGKENIRTARRLADECDSLDIRQKKYAMAKQHYEYMKSCIDDEVVFDSFYKNLEGRVEKDVARNMIETKFIDIQDKFFAGQSRYFDFFIDYQIKEDARLISADEKVC